VKPVHKASEAWRAATRNISSSRISERLGAPDKDPVDQQEPKIDGR
jgi:hypothetical protein